jgi:hypothetical protein
LKQQKRPNSRFSVAEAARNTWSWVRRKQITNVFVERMRSSTSLTPFLSYDRKNDAQFFNTFTVFRIRSTTEQMPSLVGWKITPSCYFLHTRMKSIRLHTYSNGSYQQGDQIGRIPMVIIYLHTYVHRVAILNI